MLASHLYLMSWKGGPDTSSPKKAKLCPNFKPPHGVAIDNKVHLESETTKPSSLPIGKVSTIRLLIQAIACSDCCLRKNRTERVLKRCEAKLNKELDIIQFVMRFRECRAILASKIKAGQHSKILSEER